MSAKTSSLNSVGYLTPRPPPISPTRRALVGAKTSTSSLELLELISFNLPPNLGIVLVLELRILPLVSAIPFRLKIGLPLFQILACGVLLLVLSYS